MCSMVAAGERANIKAPVSAAAQATPLQTLSTATFSDGSYLAWVEPALCEDENVYLLIAPHWREDKAEPTAASGIPSPRDVLRISADGKKLTLFNPAKGSRLVNATELKTMAVAVDPNGALFMLVWARWHGNPGQPEKSGQYIVSFDRKGEYRSHTEVDWQEILVSQFEVFGSGEFLLRGRRIQPAESRMAIFSASGQTLQDIAVSSGVPLDEPSPGSTPPRLDKMVRGGDGRIYVTQGDDLEQGDVIVYAISARGESERVFKLPPMPKAPRLVSWKAAGDRFAASYQSSGEQTSRWWIAVYRNVADGVEPETTLYGPAPGPLICYQHKRSGDRFTFLTEGAKLVTMAAR